MDQTQPGGMPQPQQIAPEQKKALDLMMKQAMSFLLDDEHANAIVTKAEAGDPKEAVREAVVPLLTNLTAAASEAGVQVEMLTVLVAGIQIIGVLAKMLVSVGLLQEQEIPAFCAEVAKSAVAEHNAGVQAGQQPAGGAGAPQPGAMPQGAQQ